MVEARKTGGLTPPKWRSGSRPSAISLVSSLIYAPRVWIFRTKWGKTPGNRSPASAQPVRLGAASALAVAASSGTAQAGAIFDAIKDKGFIQCGVSTGLAGFSNPDDAGDWSGIDVDVCRAVAAAVFRDAALGLDFVGVTYYDGQGFMVPQSLGVKSALELDGASVCVQTGTTTELNLADYFRANNMSFTPVVFERGDEARTAYEQGRCDAYTTDASGLYAQRTGLSNPDEHIVLPEVISKEPLGPVVRHGDNQWGDIVRWTLYAMLEAEEFGVDSQNVDDLKAN